MLLINNQHPFPFFFLSFFHFKGEMEHRSLTRAELEVCQAAARHGGARYDTPNAGLVNYLYRRGLVWFDVPISSEDQLSIPPLEGFVSNKSISPAGSEEVDPIETLMYQVFVAASDRVTVGKLASILNVDVKMLGVGISVACRLKFCRKLLNGGVENHNTLLGSSSGALHDKNSSSFGDTSRFQSSIPLSPPASASMTASFQQQQHRRSSIDNLSTTTTTTNALASLDLDRALATPSGKSGIYREKAAATYLANSNADNAAASFGMNTTGADSTNGGVALVVDAEVTGFLMMGALTPAVKKHSVTLFEGGRVYGTQVINELVEELKASVELAAGFEGEMAMLAGTAAALAVVLECVRRGSGGRPIELLRKESVGTLASAAAYRILSHSYSVVLPVAGLPNPPLPLPVNKIGGPINYGPLPDATTPWMHIALYAAAGQGPTSLVIPAGTRLSRLPGLLHGADAALVWPWDAAAVRASPAEPLEIRSNALLHALNHLLAKTALLVQPIDTSTEEAPAVVSVPLPLCSSSSPTTTITTKIIGYFKDGSTEEVVLPTGCKEALEKLGLGGAVGLLRLLRVVATNKEEAEEEKWVPLAVVLGVPLQPLELCRAVCTSAAAAGFLENTACKRHEEGQRALHAALLSITAQHGGRGLENGGGNDQEFFPEVPLPLRLLQITSNGRALDIAPGSAVQGLSLLH
jgi:FAM91 C-terminus/FAM91 N-terminus